jgi:hypothetical protein
MYRPVQRVARSGRHYFLWEKPDVRRISDNLLKAVVFLYPTEEAAVEGKNYGGSGFLVGWTESLTVPKQPPLTDPAHVYVVTNAHVAARCPYVRTSHELQRIIRVDSWKYHSEGDDLAIAHLGILGIDTIALGKVVHRSMFITADSFLGNQIGPGDQTFMTGRFTGLDERERNEATVRGGTLSMAGRVLVENKEWHGFLQESFFVEVNSKAGYSGSPVYVEIPPPSVTMAATGAFPADRGAFLGLLGVTWGLWRAVVPLLDPDTHLPVSGGYVVTEQSGIELVVPAWRLNDLLMEEDVVKHRKQAEMEAQRHQQRMKPDAVATDATPLPDEPIFTRETFETSLRKVSRRKPSQSDEETSGT